MSGKEGPHGLFGSDMPHRSIGIASRGLLPDLGRQRRIFCTDASSHQSWQRSRLGTLKGSARVHYPLPRLSVSWSHEWYPTPWQDQYSKSSPCLTRRHLTGTGRLVWTLTWDDGSHWGCPSCLLWSSLLYLHLTWSQCWRSERQHGLPTCLVGSWSHFWTWCPKKLQKPSPSWSVFGFGLSIGK